MIEKFEYVEISLEFCRNKNGVAPCTATPPPGRECFNTFQTCQDIENFRPGFFTYRFYRSDQALPVPIIGYPLLKSVSDSSTTIDTKNALGKRGSVSVSLGNMLATDAATDPYLSTRLTQPVGGFWERFLARNSRSYLNRPLTVVSGFIDNTKEDPYVITQRRNYFIESIEGVSADGNVTVKGVDPIKKLDDAVFPEVTGVSLLTDLPAGENRFQISNEDVRKLAPLQLFGRATLFRINDEIIRLENNFSTNITIAERGVLGTREEDHAVGDQIQQVGEFDNQTLEDALLFLFGRAGIREFLDVNELRDEVRFWLSGTNYTNYITEPTKVKELITGLVNQNLAYIWWSEKKQKIRFRAVAPTRFNELPRVIDDRANIIADSFKRRDNLKDQVTRVVVYYGKIDYNGDNKPNNFKSVFVAANLELESELLYGRVKQEIIFADWLQNEGAAQRLASRTLTKFSDGDNIIKFSLDQKDNDIDTGSDAAIITRYLVDEFGEPKKTQIQILRTTELDTGKIDYEATTTVFSSVNGNFAFFASEDFFKPIQEANELELLRTAFYGDENGKVKNGSENGYLFI